MPKHINTISDENLEDINSYLTFCGNTMQHLESETRQDGAHHKDLSDDPEYAYHLGASHAFIDALGFIKTSNGRPELAQIRLLGVALVGCVLMAPAVADFTAHHVIPRAKRAKAAISNKLGSLRSVKP